MNFKVLPLDPNLIPKFVNQLVIPPVYEPDIITDEKTGKVKSHNYTVTMSQFEQQILPPGHQKTTVWGYGGKVKDPQTGEIITDFRHTPGATFEAVRGIPVKVQWINNLTDPHPLPVDPTLHWANPNDMEMTMPPFLDFPPGYPLAQY